MKVSIFVGVIAGSLTIAAGCGGGGSGGGGSGGGGGNVAATGGETIFGITTNNRLVSFHPGEPSKLVSSKPVGGLAAGEILVAIDNRPGTGELFALGSTSRVYAINSATAVASEVGTGPFVPALSGTDFGFDFNPVVDRIRVTSDANQNLRLTPFTGVVVAADPALEYAAGDSNFGVDPQIVASAFTNNSFGMTATTLFAIDAGTDSLVRQGSPDGIPIQANAGTLFTIGDLGVDVSNEAGLDIAASGGAFACLNATGTTTSDLYVINLTTGFAALLGTIGGGSILRDIAIVPPGTPRVFAVTTANKLLSFNPATPSLLLGSVPISGLEAGEELVGIDFRPSTGTLIGLGDTSRVYEVDTTTGVATEINVLPFTPALAGTDFGMDFNPVPDRLRVVSDTGQNLRLNPNTGDVANDVVLTYAAGDTNAGLAPAIVASAYTSNFAGAGSTTLYGIDAGRDELVRQGSPGGSPQSPNSGVLFTLGSLNLDASPLTGLDISTLGGTLASITSPGGTDSQLYAVNLGTGATGLIGTIGGLTPIRDIAIEPPAPPVLYAVTVGGKLIRFLAGEPGTLLGSVAITGLQAAESVLSIDVRPATHEIVALGSSNRLYTIHPTTGHATAIGAGPFATPLAGVEYGFDFNPSVDRIRIVSDADENLRVHPVTGVIVGTDANLAYSAGDLHAGADPSLVASAYSTNFAGTMSTTLYGIDSGLNVLVRQGTTNGTLVSPNAGILFTVGNLGFDVTGVAGFDITTQGGAFAVMNLPGAPTSQLFSINLTTGLATLIGTIGGPEPVRGLAAAPVGL
jgi:3D (Asp-Asp-Asp) domain-containing protein